MEDEIIERLKLKIAISEIKKESEIAMKRKRSLISKKIGIAACACIVLISGFVYAKDIENYFKRLFINSTEAIDTAVENEYVQKEEMDYVYDKDIGVKVDNLVVDDLNLAISFSYESKMENLKQIRLENFIITNDNEKTVFRTEFKYAETLDELPIYNSLTWRNMPERTSDTTFLDSILLGLRPEAEEFNELYFDINSIRLTYLDDTYEIIEGNWKFDVTIIDEMRNSKKIQYTLLEENEYVESATATLSPTGMMLELNLKEFNDPRDLMDKLKRNECTTEDFDGYLLKYNNKTISPSARDGGGVKDSEGKIIATAKYDDISSFSNYIDKFDIYIVAFDTTITLVKEEN